MNEPLEDTEPDNEEMSKLILRVMRGVNGQAFRLFGNRVYGGPFAGMIIPERVQHWDDGNFGTKLLGCYEHELHDVIHHAVWRYPNVLIDVGCSEGYYAIGFARMHKDLRVHALDISDAALTLCSMYATINGVKDQVYTARGARDPSELRFRGIEGRRLYMIDCEGDEAELIDLEACPELKHSDIIVECHDFMRPSMSRILADRLAATHKVELIRPTMPDFGQFQFLRQLPSIISVLMVVEKRPMPCYWLACWANSRGVQDG